MARIDPAFAAVRTAVRTAITGYLPGPVLVACSGGVDSLALASATVFVASRSRLRAGLITVDHQLQQGSAERAAMIAAWGRGQGFNPVEVATVKVAGRPGGPEAAARDARYEALLGSARAHGAAAVLLGHTRDDQAETVLLALLRGAGLRGLAGMPAARSVGGVDLLRPLLGLSREQTRAACAASGLTPWQDPHNSDPGYARSRARSLLAELSGRLGPQVTGNLARTAALAAADAEVLDALADSARAEATDPDGALRVASLRGLQAALRTRVLHGWARAIGTPGSALSYRHVVALDELVSRWHGQGAVYLPGGVEVHRERGRITWRQGGRGGRQ